MNYFLSLLCVTFISFNLFAAPDGQISSVIDMLRNSPATITGEIAFENSFNVYKGKKYLLDVKMQVNANQKLGFAFSEHHLAINPDKGMTLLIQGIPVKVREIYYDDRAGKFSVKTEIPVGKKFLNSQIEAELNAIYKPKIIEAFKKLKELRTYKQLDVKQIAKSFADIFLDKNRPAIPNSSGSISLGFSPENDITIEVPKKGKEKIPKQALKKSDLLKVGIKKNDFINAGVTFVRKGDRSIVTGVEVTSSQGIQVIDQTLLPEVTSISLKNLKFGEKGSKEFTYDIGAEDVILGFKAVTSLLKTLSGQPASVSLADCDPVVLEYKRKEINEELRVNISKAIKDNYSMLIEAGAPPELLSILD